MNYRHVFHAGNFADVFKHAVLARILVHLAEKPQAYRVIDTHAGTGLYDLEGTQASRTGEWREGIGRLLRKMAESDRKSALNDGARALLKPYLDAIAAQNTAAPSSATPGADAPRFYPGSPLIALALMRPQDRLTACELEPKAASALSANLRRDKRANVFESDGWQALNAHLPPPERRGLVVIDPPFEVRDELDNIVAGLELAQRKWASGSYLIWYPVKGAGTSAFVRRLRKLGMAKVLRAELHLRPAQPDLFTGSGLILVNPPWRLADELKVLLPGLQAALTDGRTGRSVVEWVGDNI